MAHDQQGRPLVHRTRHLRMSRRIVERMHRARFVFTCAGRRRESHRFGHRHPALRQRLVHGTPHQLYRGVWQRHARDHRRLRRRSAHAGNAVARGHDRLDDVDGQRHIGGRACARIDQAQLPPALAHVGRGDAAVAEVRIRRHREHPLWLPEIGVTGTQRRQRPGARIVGLRPIQVPPAGAIRHEVQHTVRRPGRLEHRLTGPSGHALSCHDLSLRVEVADPQLGAVPGHLRMAPLQPGQELSVGRDDRIGVEIGTLDQHRAMPVMVAAIRGHGDNRGPRLARTVARILAHHHQSASPAIDTRLGEGTAPGRQRMWCASSWRRIQPLVGKMRGIDDTRIDADRPAAVLVRMRPGVEVRRQHLVHRALRPCTHHDRPTGLGWTAFNPVQRITVDAHLAEPKGPGGNPGRAQG